MCEVDGPAPSATTWMVKLPLAMAGNSGVTVNVTDMPLPRISIGVCGCRIGDIGADQQGLALRSVALASPSVPQQGSQEWLRRPERHE